jgi:hypothetical protein
MDHCCVSSGAGRAPQRDSAAEAKGPEPGLPKGAKGGGKKGGPGAARKEEGPRPSAGGEAGLRCLACIHHDRWAEVYTC